jgi:hypothetical protein
MADSNLPEVPSEGKKAVAVVGGTAVTGAIIGSFIPGVGTVIGAGVGGIIGGIGVLAGEIQRKNRRVE